MNAVTIRKLFETPRLLLIAIVFSAKKDINTGLAIIG